MWIERLMAGISHQHVLSYNPNPTNRLVRPYLMDRKNTGSIRDKMAGIKGEIKQGL